MKSNQGLRAKQMPQSPSMIVWYILNVMSKFWGYYSASISLRFPTNLDNESEGDSYLAEN